MNRRPDRNFDRLSEAQLLAGLTATRRVNAAALVHPPSRHPPSRKGIADLLETIEHVAEAATGERSFLHVKLRTP